MDKKNVLSLLPAVFVLCNRVEISEIKLQVISSCSEQNIFILVDKIFQHISVGLSRLIDRLFTNLLNINFTETRTVLRTEENKSSDDEEFRIFKLKLV